MEQWQIEALQSLLATNTNEVEEGTRVYTSSKVYGESRYHLLEKRFDGIQIEQVKSDEKWGSRINIESDELPAVLKTLLSWYLESAHRPPEQQEATDEDPYELGDLLDEKPF